MSNPFEKLATELEVKGKKYKYYSLPKLEDPRLGGILAFYASNSNKAKLPYSIRILLESAVRSCDNARVPEKDIETILNWGKILTKITAFIDTS